MIQNQEPLRSAILDQIHMIYCTQVHLYERCTELDVHKFKGLKKQIDIAIKLSSNRIKCIETFYSTIAINDPFKDCNSLYTYLEEKFAPNYKRYSDFEIQLHINNYLINNYFNAIAADSMIRSLMISYKNENQQNELNKLLKDINLVVPDLVI